MEHTTNRILANFLAFSPINPVTIVEDRLRQCLIAINRADLEGAEYGYFKG